MEGVGEMSEFDMNSYVLGMGAGGGGGGSSAMIADAYSAESTYAEGDYCTHDGKLYVCNTTISTAEEWTAAHWTEAVLGDDVADLKSAISSMLHAPETISGSTPSITAKPGVRYICGEVSTLAVTAPASGIIDVVFESGSTPTVLTVTSAKSGVTAIKWAGGFDPTSLDANTTYEINIMDGEYGVAAAWT